MGCELAVKFLVGVLQLHSSGEQSICDRVFAGENAVLEVVAFPLSQEKFTSALRIG